MSILEQYKSDMVALVDFRVGSIIEQIQGYTSGVAGTPTWTNTKKGKGLKCPYGTRDDVTIIGDPYSLTDGTLIMLINRDKVGLSSYSEICGSGSSMSNIYINSSNVVGVYDYSTPVFKSSGLTIADYLPHVITFVFQSGVTNGSCIYVDGIKGDDFTWTHNAVSNTYTIGSGADAALSGGVTFNLFSMLDKVDLTGKEISDLSVDLLLERGQGDPKTRNYKYFPKVAKDSTLVVCHEGNCINGLIPDLSGNNLVATNHGLIHTPGIGVSSALNGKGTGYASYTGDGDVMEGNYSFACWLKAVNITGSSQCLFSRSPQYIGLTNAETIIAAYQNSAGSQVNNDSDSALAVGSWSRIGVTFEVSGSNVTTKFYINGELDATHTETDGFQAATAGLLLNGLSSSANLCNFDWQDLRYYNEVKDAEWFANDYKQGAKHSIYQSESRKWLPTLSNVTDGEISNTDFKVSTGTWKVSQEALQNSSQLLADGDMEDPQTYGSEELADGDMEDATTASYSVDNSATLTKELGTRTGGSGSLVLRVENTDTWGAAREPNAIESTGTYLVSGWARGDGTAYPAIGQGSVESIWVGTNSTGWQYFEEVFESTGTYVRMTKGSTVGTTYAEFDDVSVKKITGGTADWTAGSSAVLTKETTSPQSGTQNIKVAYNGASYPTAYQDVLTIGKTYRVKGWFRGDGSVTPRIYFGANVVITGTSSTTWQYFDMEAEATTNGNLSLMTVATSAGYAEFDNVVVQEYGSGKKWIESAVGGVTYTKQDKADGTVVFEIRKGSDANRDDIFFMAEKPGTYDTAGQYGYAFVFNNNEEIQFEESTNGVGAKLADTAAGYLENNKTYTVAISRSSAGVFTMYIKGGAFTTWTLVDFTGGSGTNPLTDTTTTTSKYFSASLAAGDKFRLLNVHQGLLTLDQLNTLY